MKQLTTKELMAKVRYNKRAPTCANCCYFLAKHEVSPSQGSSAYCKIHDVRVGPYAVCDTHKEKIQDEYSRA